MDRGQLQHVIHAIGRRFDLSDIYIVGSAANLAMLPNPPEGALTATRDVDVIPLNDKLRRLSGHCNAMNSCDGCRTSCVPTNTVV